MYKNSIEKRGKDGFPIATKKKKNLKVTMKVRNKTKQIKTSNNKWNTRIYDTWPFLHPPITFLYIYEG